MGHKVHPYGFRIGINKPWLAKWYADRDYASLLQEDMRIRQLVAKQLSNASVSQVEIERGINHVTVTVHSAKPGIVIGKGGANVEALRTNIGKLTNKKVKLEIKEILQPELDGVLVAQNVAGQLERRIAFRKAIKQTVQRTIKAGAKGVRIQVSGRLGGSEMSRTEWDKEGRIPLGTLRADISYGMVHALTTAGRIGVKAWIYRGEQLGERPGSARTEPREARRPARGRTERPSAGGSSRPAPARAATATEGPTGTGPETAQPEVDVAPVAKAAQDEAAQAADTAQSDTAQTDTAQAEAPQAEAATPEAPAEPEPAAEPEAPAAKESAAEPEATAEAEPAAAPEEPAGKPAAPKAKAERKGKGA